MSAASSTLGRFTGVKGPGLIILIPFAQQMVKVDLRVVVQDVPPQDVITRDNVTVKVNAVLYFRIVDSERAIIKVADFLAATSQLAHQGDQCRDQTCRSQRKHDPRDRQAGRGRAVAACKGDQCRGRAAGRREARRGWQTSGPGTTGD